MANFDHEGIPESVVQARGTGAGGVFKATADLNRVKNKQVKNIIVSH